MNEIKNWKWATIVLGALLLVILACCVGAWFGGLVGLSFGRRLARPAYSYEMPRMMPEPVPPVPMPSVPTPPLPEFPEMPRPETTAWLGVAFRMVDKGALIETVIAGSPAEAAGLQVNDIITEVNGRAVTEMQPLNQHIRRYAPGDMVRLSVLRDGRERTLNARLGTQF